MGCFPYTCSVSSLPISAGDPVRFLAVAQNLDSDARFICEVDSLWQPIALPIKGVYNDYGSVTELEAGPITNAFFEALNTLAVEREVGENRVHDVAVVKGMSTECWLRALWEERVQIPDRHGAARLQVAQTMVREDVWQILVGECWHSDDSLKRSLQRPFVLGPFKRYTMPSSPDEVVLSATVELLRVQLSLATLGRHWTRGTTIGRAEHSSWAAQERFSKLILAIASKRATSTQM